MDESFFLQPQPSHPDQPNAESASSEWQIAGELELSFGADAQSLIGTWLADVLGPLRLHVGFLNQVRRSAEEAAAHAMQTERVIENRHAHLLILIPASRPPDVQTWGFFRIDKLDPSGANEAARNHSIEFYLYLEGP